MSETDNLYVEMIGGGWTPRAPDLEVGIHDGELFERRPCSRCGGRVSYHPFSKAGKYKAFVVCVEAGCGFVEEV